MYRIRLYIVPEDQEETGGKGSMLWKGRNDTKSKQPPKVGNPPQQRLQDPRLSLPIIPPQSQAFVGNLHVT
ncbi:hypothetical protein LSTR_LSTR002030 [Laodelphax striatellus]|uniref:Uncharacterized protein n=1 Tax=Laodelphax striatellus TaxID=195883 RepID=A0A482XHT6_LAOST|nr:hypothetical protein LSTR_LSTR002030 [Laodelphax striatellus]